MLFILYFEHICSFPTEVIQWWMQEADGGLPRPENQNISSWRLEVLCLVMVDGLKVQSPTSRGKMSEFNSDICIFSLINYGMMHVTKTKKSAVGNSYARKRGNFWFINCSTFKFEYSYYKNSIVYYPSCGSSVTRIVNFCIAEDSKRCKN